MNIFLGVISFSLVFYVMISRISGVPVATSYSYRIDGHSGYSQRSGYNRVARSNYGESPSTSSYAVYVIHDGPPNWEEQNYAYPLSYGTPYYRKHFDGRNDIGDFNTYFDGNPTSYWKDIDGYGVDFNNDDYHDDDSDRDNSVDFGYPEYGFDDAFDYGGNHYYKWKYV